MERADAAAPAHGPSLRQALFQKQDSYAILVADRNGEIVDWNPTATRIYGYSRDEALNKSLFFLHKSSGATELILRMKESLRRYGQFAGEVPFDHKDGTAGITDTVIFQFFDENGEPGSISINRDISDRQRAENELTRQTRANALLHEIATAANNDNDPDGAIRTCLREVCAFSGWSVGHAFRFGKDGSGELVSADLWHMEKPARYAMFRAVTEHTRFNPGEGFAGQVAASAAPLWLGVDLPYPNSPRAMARIQCGLQSGFAVPVMVGARVAAVLEFFTEEVIEKDVQLLDLVGRIGVLIGRVIERQQMDEERAWSEKRISGIVDLALEAIISIDADGNITLFNKGAEDIFGYKAGEMLGRPLDELLPERFRGGHTRHIAEFQSARDVSRHMGRRGTLYGLRRDGTEFPAEASISKLELPSETILTVMLRDVTERKRAEEAVVAAKEEAEQASQAKSEFLANMSHELRTPLNAIIGFSDLLADELRTLTTEKAALEYAGHIYNAGQHLLTLINDILDIAKVESGVAELAEENVDAAALVRSCVAMVSERARSGDVDLIIDIDTEFLPNLRADKTKLKQIILNLLSNAIKFTKPGGTVSAKAWFNTGGFVFQFCDTGIGIAAEDIPKALARFQQIDGALNRRHDGTGLGLPLAKALAEQHGGSLDLQSRLGQGTTVTVRLPCNRAITLVPVRAA